MSKMFASDSLGTLVSGREPAVAQTVTKRKETARTPDVTMISLELRQVIPIGGAEQSRRARGSSEGVAEVLCTVVYSVVQALWSRVIFSFYSVDTKDMETCRYLDLAYIGKETDKHFLQVANICAQRNSCLPVFRLPTEILADIFTHGAQNHYERNDHPFFRVPDWVNVSYVCRHWRDVALNCPTLWAYHFTVSLRWTEELLARSKQSSLKIRIKHNSMRAGPWWSDLIEMVLNHAERIQELRIHIPAVLFPTYFSLYAPCLQMLDICTWNERHPAIAYRDINVPLLRSLKLSGCPLPWHSLNLSKLTTLFLCHVPTPSKQSLEVLLAALSRMRALTFLHLEDALCGALSGEAQKVDLPHLSRLFIVAPLYRVVSLLSCINIPLRTHVRLEIQGQGSSADEVAQLIPLFVQRFNPSKDTSPTIRSLAIRYCSDDASFAISASEHKARDTLLSKAYPPRDSSVAFLILIAMNPSVYFAHREQLVSDICCVVPATHIQTLHVIEPPSSPYFWKRTLGHLCGLRYMTLSDGRIPDLVPLLALPLVTRGHITRDHEDDELVPALEELALQRIEFLPHYLHGDVVFARKTRPLRLTLTGCTRFVDSLSLNELEHAIDKHRFAGI